MFSWGLPSGGGDEGVAWGPAKILLGLCLLPWPILPLL